MSEMLRNTVVPAFGYALSGTSQRGRNLVHTIRGLAVTGELDYLDMEFRNER